MQSLSAVRAICLICCGLTVTDIVQASSDHLLLTSPLVQGSTVYSQSQLAALYATHLGRPTTRGGIEEIIEAINSRYRADGFVAPIIEVPSSELTSGTPRLFVHEASIARVLLRGDAGPSQAQLLRYVQTLREQHLIHRNRSRQLLQAMQRLPGVTVRAAFEPSGVEPNEFNLILDVSYRPASGMLDINNRGTRAIGRGVMSGHLAVNGLLHWQEILSLDAAGSTEFDRYQYVAVGLSRPLGAIWISMAVSRSNADPVGDVHYREDRADLWLTAPVWHAEHTQLASIWGISAWDDKTQDELSPAFSADHVRRFDIGLELTQRGTSFTRTSLTFGHGYDALGASAVSFDGLPVPSTQYTKEILSVEHVHNLPANFRVRMKFVGQYSSAELPGAERFAFGGSWLGRDFDVADLTGDSGAVLGTQLERSLSWPRPWFDDATVFTGVDYGTAWNHALDRLHHDYASSAGVGIILGRSQWMTSFELTYPIHSPLDASSPSGLRAFIDLRTSFK